MYYRCGIKQMGSAQISAFKCTFLTQLCLSGHFKCVNHAMTWIFLICLVSLQTLHYTVIMRRTS